MIPLKLTLRNFMSYGDESQTLDFTGMHVACFSGDNGNGKSALLDAMTYALWGKTRATGSQASGEDDLVRLGADDLEVALEFLLGEDRYRAIRKRNRRSRTGDWQVHLCDISGEWRAVGGTGMRETEKQLVRILRMEYETFLNSAYIQQGRADEFTRQKPDARKRILADILDLSRYDRLEEMAKERRNEADLTIRDLDREIHIYEAQSAEAATHRERLTEEEAHLAHWTAERAAREERLTGLRSQLAVLEEKAQNLQMRAERMRDVEQEVAETDLQIARLRAKMADDAAILSGKTEIERDYHRLVETRQRVDALEAEVRSLQQAQQEKQRLEGQLALKRQELKNLLANTEAEWRQAEERKRTIAELERRLEDVAPKLAFFESAKSEREQVRAELQVAQDHFTELHAQSKKLKSELAEREEVLPFLEGPKSACPVCETDLSGGRREAVLLKQQQRIKTLKEMLAEVTREGAAVKKDRDALQARYDHISEQLQSEAALRAQQTEWRRLRDEAAARNADAPAIQGRLEAIRRQIQTEEYGAEERTLLAQLEKDLTRLQSAAREHTETQAVVRDLTSRQVERLYAQVEEAERAQAHDRQEVDRLLVQREKRAGQIEAERAKQSELRSALEGFDNLRLEVAGEEALFREAASECDTARAQVERRRHALEECARAAETAAKKKSERDRLAKDKQAYTDLAAAFGKKGVQAHIIDNALPEIQEEANRLLARLTDNAMQVELTTLRTARTGSQQIETLDIQITDDAGTRPYEMYSGGEAFRVNFAIRIALSRLLARRAGARLQTLVIDEGFGTQDAKGRERLVEAIDAVQDEFALILVISHIEELKDAFPTRIEITKTPTGSQINYLQ